MFETTSTTADADVPRLGLSRVNTARAFDISTRTLDSLIADRTSGIPFARIGAKLVFPVRELTEWLAERAAESRRAKSQ